MPDNGTGERRRRVVIVGGGFGGLAAARRLRRADVDVTVIDRMNHHLFQPLLYQVAVGAVSTGSAPRPIRVALRHGRRTNVLMDEVVDVDVDGREVVLDRGERIGYDSLIVACGAETSYFGKDEWQDVTCGLKTLADAVDLRNRIFGAFEQAERTTDPEARKEWLTFAVIGGGPTGVEIAGALAVAAKDSRKGDYARIAPRRFAGDPARCRRACPLSFQRVAVGQGRQGAGRARRDRARRRAGHGDRLARSDDRCGRLDASGSPAARSSGPPACGPSASPEPSPAPPGRRPTAAGASRSSRT